MTDFAHTIRPTVFGLFDTDLTFQADADLMAIYVKRMLGDDVLNIELTSKSIWECFEEATIEWGSLISQYQIKSQFATLLGMPTSSSTDVVNLYLRQSLELLNRQAEPYASTLGIGGSYNVISGSIDLIAGQQDYNLYTDLKNSSGSTLYSLQPSGSVTKMKILDVYHRAPVIPIANSQYLGNFVAGSFRVESYIPDTRFYVLPLYEDVLRGQELKTAQKIRRSQYSYEIMGTNLRIYPMPDIIDDMNKKLWVRVMYNPDPTNPAFQDDTIKGISNVSNVPIKNPIYSQINPYGKNWIKKYCLSTAKHLVGLIRSKVKGIPISDKELQLDGEELKAEAKDEKEKLATELKEFLDEMTYDKVVEREVAKAENLQKQLKYVPINPKYLISMAIFMFYIFNLSAINSFFS